MSTIERAAERLSKSSKSPKDDLAPDTQASVAPVQADQAQADQTRVDESLSPDSAVEHEHDGARTGQVGEVAAASVVEQRTRTFVGGGYHELDLESLHEKGFLSTHTARSKLALDFRRIKRPLLIGAQHPRVGDDEHPTNLVVVTSSVPGEGKTFVAINLAMSIATEVDFNVLLVDGDVARDSISNVLGLQYDKGLTDVLARGGSHLEDSIYRTNIEHLAVLPSGTDLPNTDELLASELMHKVAADLAAEDPHRIVIVDAPPLLAGTEANVLGRLAGQIVLVVEADSTPRATVSEALSQLAGRDGVSLVLNKVPARNSDHAYGYGYTYGD